ncbi:hypothetical protein Pcinc_044007 [Petrolisthes cinctipes]|uniref:Uncharacterized protein n=1 Tax=Petrolisthes cinctipes TaxID=88211 RepID=A0AAE1EFS0_PETCI|nr:hypothetical protein Pcinc_044007 [Petrolisthes cinctipes]
MDQSRSTRRLTTLKHSKLLRLRTSRLTKGTSRLTKGTSRLRYTTLTSRARLRAGTAAINARKNKKKIPITDWHRIERLCWTKEGRQLRPYVTEVKKEFARAFVSHRHVFMKYLALNLAYPRFTFKDIQDYFYITNKVNSGLISKDDCKGWRDKMAFITQEYVI